VSAAEVVEFNPEVDHEQLALDGDAFRAVVSLAEAGAITPVSLDLTDPEMPYETAAMLGRYFGRMNRSCSWWIGDLIVACEGLYGERFAQIAAETGLSEQTLLSRTYVAKNIPRSRRRAGLSFSVHALVAKLDARAQKTWLDRAEKNGWSAKDLAAAMKALRKDEQPTLLGDDADIDKVELAEVARAILRDAKESGDPAYYLIPREDMARLAAALGEEA
jgi:hypothetical protein